MRTGRPPERAVGDEVFRLAKAYAGDYARRWGWPAHRRAELEAELALAGVVLVGRHDPTLGAFSTYFYSWVSTCVRRVLRSERELGAHGASTAPSAEEQALERLVSAEDVDTARLLLSLAGELTDQERQLLHDRLMADQPATLATLAEQWGVSRPAVLGVERKLLARLSHPCLLAKARWRQPAAG
jgi:RNA polymerase sigma factor (sigma-70 family)